MYACLHVQRLFYQILIKTEIFQKKLHWKSRIKNLTKIRPLRIAKFRTVENNKQIQ
jgi:hypothetical protein